MKRSNALFGLCLLVLGVYVLASPPSGYRLLKKIPFSAAPGTIEYFDYITFDAATRRVYLSHGTEVKMLDADSASVIGTVSDLPKTRQPLERLNRSWKRFRKKRCLAT